MPLFLLFFCSPLIRTWIGSNNIFTWMHNFRTLVHFAMDFGGAPGFCSRIQATTNRAWPASQISYNNNSLASLWRLASMLLLLLLLPNDSTLHRARGNASSQEYHRLPPHVRTPTYSWTRQGSGLSQACIFLCNALFFSAVFHRHNLSGQPFRPSRLIDTCVARAAYTSIYAHTHPHTRQWLSAFMLLFMLSPCFCLPFLRVLGALFYIFLVEPVPASRRKTLQASIDGLWCMGSRPSSNPCLV